MLNKQKKQFAIFIALFSALFINSQISYAAECQNPNPIWEDNFDGNSLDTSKWDVMTGDGCSYGICGWGNSELQNYQADNATVSNGLLTITAKQQRIRGTKYTSARLRTLGVPNGGEWTHGRFEARVKLPDGAGMWPAFWMLPSNPDVGWPESGEIDIVESTGQASNNVFGTIHTGVFESVHEFTGNGILKQPDKWSDDFHVYAIEWEPNIIRWYVDDLLYSVKTPDDLSNTSYWRFENYQYHLLLNLAVGGTLGGTVDDSALPQTMQVDYVRVYDNAQPSLSGAHIANPNSTETYQVIDEAGTGSSYTWTAPAGATIVSGANSNTVQVEWGTASGPLQVTVNNSCGTRDLALDVFVTPVLSLEFTHDDFESERNLTYTANDGVFNQSAANPDSSGLNSSTTVAEYTRDSSVQYDVIAADTNNISDMAPYLVADKAFFMDVYTAAPIGTEILVQVENSNVATPINYPNGRHSKYVAYTSVQNQWERLQFKLQERIDADTTDNSVDSVVLLFASNTFTGDTYFWDNFASYGLDGGPSPNNPPTAAFSTDCIDLACTFDASSSSDSDGSVVAYAWDFGDGNSNNGQTVNHAFATEGTYTVTLTVTDDDDASDSASQGINVSVAGPSSTMSVSNVSTGTQGAGRGQKRATATITVVDNNGNPVSDVTVTGDFSGTIVESGVSGVTDADGTVTLTTSSTSGGKLTVSFCVSSLQHASLTHSTSDSVGLCQ